MTRRRPHFRSCDEEASYMAWRSERNRVYRIARRRIAGRYPAMICGICGHMTFGNEINHHPLKGHTCMHLSRFKRMHRLYRLRRRHW